MDVKKNVKNDNIPTEVEKNIIDIIKNTLDSEAVKAIKHDVTKGFKQLGKDLKDIGTFFIDEGNAIIHNDKVQQGLEQIGNGVRELFTAVFSPADANSDNSDSPSTSSCGGATDDSHAFPYDTAELEIYQDIPSTDDLDL